MKTNRSGAESKQAIVEIKVERSASRMQQNPTVTLNDNKSNPGDRSPMVNDEDQNVQKKKGSPTRIEVAPIDIPVDPSRQNTGLTSEVTDLQIESVKKSKAVSVKHSDVYENADHGSTLGKTLSPNTADGTQRAVIITRSINNPIPSNVKVSTQGSVGNFEDVQKEL